METTRTNRYIRDYLTELAGTLSLVNFSEIEDTISLLEESRMRGSRIFICGNGGSAATASHFACDLVKGTMKNGMRTFKVIPLTDNVPLITAWANDTDYENIFGMQLEPLVERDDIVIGISGSGNSQNVVRAMEIANLRGAITIGITGFDGGRVKSLVRHSLHVDSFNMQQVEDIHMILVHLMTSALRDLAPAGKKQPLQLLDIEI